MAAAAATAAAKAAAANVESEFFMFVICTRYQYKLTHQIAACFFVFSVYNLTSK